MAASVYFVGIVAVIILIIVGIGTPFLLIPAVVIALALVVVPLLLRVLRGSAVAEPDAGPSGVPSTREASYDPVREP